MVSNLNVRPVVSPESESKQTFHRWMKRGQAATLGLVVGIFVMALWVSINWKQAAPFEVAFWWMSFALSGIPLTIFVGLDIIFARGASSPSNGEIAPSGWSLSLVGRRSSRAWASSRWPWPGADSCWRSWLLRCPSTGTCCA